MTAMNRGRKHVGIIVSVPGVLAGVMSVAAFCAVSACPAAANEATTAPTTQPAKEEVMLTICYDNNPGRENLKPAWGFACVVRGLEKTILFDTGGDGRTLLANMKALDVQLAEIDLVVISHIHGDHTGGLWDFLQARGGVPVYMPAGFPAAFGERIEKLGGKAIVADESTAVCEGAKTTGTMGKGQIEEHGLCVQTPVGWALITGCAHPGIAHMAERATRLVESPLNLVVGGFHMGGASRQQVEAVIEQLEKLGVATVAPCHCSGDNTRKLFKEHCGKSYTAACVGTSLRFPSQEHGEEPRPSSP
ncbi:MAG: MBL fold metallo-hydrolase [Phycisphaerae bacterium]|nr:MBL fold metallo-hydrolase [Phycisphaerae bacterium]